MSLRSEILFIPRFHEKNAPPEWDTFHPAFPWEKCPTWMRYFSSSVSMRKMPHLNEILFIPCFHEKNAPPEWDTFHPVFSWEKCPTWMRYFSSELVCMPIFKKFCITFIAYWFCCLYFDLELVINIHTAKFYKMNCTFLCNNFKNTPSLN